MPDYIVRFAPVIDISVTVSADDEESAEETALRAATEFGATIFQDRSLGVAAVVNFDAVEAYEVAEQPGPSS